MFEATGAGPIPDSGSAFAVAPRTALLGVTSFRPGRPLSLLRSAGPPYVVGRGQLQCRRRVGRL